MNRSGLVRVPYFAVTAGIALLATAPAAFAVTLCVNPGGTGGCFAAIQAAVDAAQNGDLIDVAAGTYAENVSIPSGLGAIELAIKGAGAGSTIIDGSGTGTLVFIGAGCTVTLSGLTLTNGAKGLATNEVDPPREITISDCEVSNNTERGIRAGARVLTVTNTLVTGNAGSGISVGGNQVLIQGSTISQNTADVGMAVGSGGGVFLFKTRATIQNCRIENNTAGSGSGGLSTQLSRVTVIDSSITQNSAQAGGGLTATKGRLDLIGTTVSGNTASMHAGGIWANGRVRLTNSTVSGNQAPLGAGILLDPPGRVLLRSTTVASNFATVSGGGIRVDPVARIIALNTLIGDNSAPAASDCEGTLRRRGYNLVEDASGCLFTGTSAGHLQGVDPMLGPLANNGGPTDTQALLAGSPAIDAGYPGPPIGRGRACPPTDQRGLARNGVCDIGAYEAP